MKDWVDFIKKGKASEAKNSFFIYKNAKTMEVHVIDSSSYVWSILHLSLANSILDRGFVRRRVVMTSEVLKRALTVNRLVAKHP